MFLEENLNYDFNISPIMFHCTKTINEQKGHQSFWFTRRWFSEKNWKPPVSDELREKVSKMVNWLEKEIATVNNQYEVMVYAVEHTILDRAVDLVYKIKALELIIEENKIPGSTIIKVSNREWVQTKKVCTNLIHDVGRLASILPYSYGEIIRDMLSEPGIPHWSKLCKYMPINEPQNFLDDLFAKLTSAPLYFRELVQEACGWTIDAFFARKANRVLMKRRRVLDHPFTEAESDKIIAIFREIIIPELINTCNKWESIMREQKKNRLK